MLKLILFLSFSVFSAQAATYEGAKIYRLVRSPHYGAHFHYDHPPFGPPPLFPAPPPVIYRTHNWSGVGRGADGAVKGVFSGAAATAGGAVPTLNSAFSIAEAGSAECDDNSHSSDSKITSQYNSKSSQYGSHQFGSGSGSHVGQVNNNESGGYGGSSGYNSHSSFKESSSSFTQSGQNGASNGFGQVSNTGSVSQTPDIDSGYDKNFRGYGGHGQSFSQSHYSVQNGRGSEFESEGSNNGKDYESFSGRGQSNSGSNKPQAQGSSSNYGQVGASSLGSAQSGSSAFGAGSSNYNSGAQGYDSSKLQAGGSLNIESQQLKSTDGTEQSFGHESGFASGQTSNNDAEYIKHHGAFASKEISGSGSSTSGGFYRPQTQGSSSDSYGHFGASSQGFAQSGLSDFGSGSSNYNSGAHGYYSSKLQTGENSNFQSHQLKSPAGSEQSFEHRNSLASGQTNNNAAGFGQSGTSSAFETGSNKYNSGAHGYGNTKLQVGGSAKLESQELKSATGAEQSFKEDVGLASGQTGNSGAEFGQSSGSSTFGSRGGHYNSGNHGDVSGTLQAGGSANFESQQAGIGAEHSFEHGASLTSGHTGNNAAEFGQSSGSSAYGSGRDNYNSGILGDVSGKLQAGEIAHFETQQAAVGAEHSFGHEAGLASGQTGTNTGGHGQLGSTLNGALELASQGLQAADNAKCATCQKSSYALSNAKSYNGAAIALSIGG